MSKKLIVVTGATGLQGGSVIRALLEDGRYAIRGLTRKVDSPAAQALTAKGVEMVQGDPANKDSLMVAFNGAYAVFGVTVPAFIPGSTSEYQQGKNLVDACKGSNVPLFVWSSLPSVKETSNGKYTMVTAFDEKAEVDKYIKTVGQPAVVFKTGGFVSNLLRFGQLRPSASKPTTWELHYPYVGASTPNYVTYVEKDLGPAVVAVITAWEDPALKEELGRDPIPLISFSISGEEKVKIISEVTGKEVTYIRDEPTEGINAHPALKQMYQWSDEGWLNYPEGVPPPILLKLGVKFHTFEDYVREEVAPFMKKQEQGQEA